MADTYEFTDMGGRLLAHIVTNAPFEELGELALEFGIDVGEILYERTAAAPSVRGFPEPVSPTVKALSAEVDELRLECKRLEEENARLRKGFDELKAMIGRA